MRDTGAGNRSGVARIFRHTEPEILALELSRTARINPRPCRSTGPGIVLAQRLVHLLRRHLHHAVEMPQRTYALEAGTAIQVQINDFCLGGQRWSKSGT